MDFMLMLLHLEYPSVLDLLLSSLDMDGHPQLLSVSIQEQLDPLRALD